MTHQELLDIWKKPHEDYLEKGKAALKKTKERLKRQQDAKIVRTTPIFDIGDLILLHNDSKATKLEREWLGPYTVIKRINEVNYELLYDT